MATGAGIYWLSREQAGKMQYSLPGPEDGQRPLGLLSKPAGGAAYVGLDSPGYPDHLVVLGDGIIEPRIADRWAANTRVYPRALTLGPIASTRSMLLQTNDGTLYSGTAGPTSESELRRERGFAGIWSVGSTAAGTGVFRVLQDGTADRLVLSPTGLELQRVGEVQRPAGQSPIGLFEATLEAAPVVLAVTLELSAQPHVIGADPFYALHVCKVTQALAATPLVRSPAFGVQVMDLPGLADGTACVIDVAAVTCVGPIGTAVAVPAHLVLTCTPEPWLALSDGTFTAPAIDTVTGANVTMRVTPTTKALRLYDARQCRASTWSPEGASMGHGFLGAWSV